MEKLFSRSDADHLGHDPPPASSLQITEEEVSTVAEETITQGVECTSHACEAEVAAKGGEVEERLFTVRDTCPPHTADESQVTHSHKKRRKFKFKKGTVAPQEPT